jgi:hypothetical protein
MTCCCSLSFLNSLFINCQNKPDNLDDIGNILNSNEIVMYRWITEDHCPICLDELTDKRNISKWLQWLQWLQCICPSNVATMTCTHKFHSDCISLWFQYSMDRTCPICRKRVNFDSNN